MKTLYNKLPRIYCLTLAEEPWKRTATESHFDDLGIFATFYDGFHGPTLGIAPQLACEYAPDGTRTYAHINQIGAVISHLALLRMALTLDQCGEFIITEDDVVFEPDIHERWGDVKRDLIDYGVEVAQLEYLGHTDKHTEQITKNLSRCCYPFGLAATWWTARAARLAIQAMRPICEPTDIAFMRRVYPFLNHAIVTPPLAHQRSAEGEWTSSIGAEMKPVPKQ